MSSVFDEEAYCIMVLSYWVIFGSRQLRYILLIKCTTYLACATNQLHIVAFSLRFPVASGLKELTSSIPLMQIEY